MNKRRDLFMPTPNIYNNKYTPGPLPEICAPRTKLLARLEQAAQKRLIFIFAPAGSGKTVSTKLWLQTSNRKTVWIGLDAFDNSISVFYRMFCTGLLAAQPDNERMAAILRSVDFNATPVEHTINLLAEFIEDGNRYILTLDDFHTITNREIIKSLTFIIKRMPHSFIMLILSRTEPPEHLSEPGQMEIVSAEDLAFGADEIKTYFALRGREMTGEEAQTAFAYTCGWAIGVNALAHSDSPMPDGSGGHILENYIKKQIWDEWDGSLRAFILSSASIDEIPVTLCEKITGRADAEELLENLRAENAFVSRIEDGVYRYHHLFLDFLRALPEYTEEDNKKHWSAAAEYYLKKEEYIARYYAYKSGNTKIILNTLDVLTENRGHSFDEYLDHSQDLFLSGAIDVLSEKCPVFYISCAWTAFLSGDAGLFEKYEDMMKRSLPVILLKYPSFGEVSFSLMALDYRTPFAKQIARAKFLPPINIKGDALKAVSMSLQMPFLHRSTRDYYELTDTKLYNKLKKTFGKLLKKHYELVMHDVYAGLCLEQNRGIEALAEAQTAVSLLADWTVKEIRFATYMHLAAVYLALGKEDELAVLLDETGRFVNESAQFLRPNFLAFVARVKLWNGDGQVAQEWLDNYFVGDDRILRSYRLYQYFTTVRAYIVLGELEKAKDLAERLRQMGEDFRRPQDAAEAGVLLSVILWAMDQKEKAQKMMETVLLEMQPHAFVRLIADEGVAVVPVLKKASGRAERADHSNGLDPVYVNNVYLTAYAVSKQRRGITANLEMKPVKLSKQQKKILELLAQGHKREGIMQKTGLSLNTVKTHTRLAYEKLNVSNAADAILKARELGIIE